MSYLCPLAGGFCPRGILSRGILSWGDYVQGDLSVSHCVALRHLHCAEYRKPKYRKPLQAHERLERKNRIHSSVSERTQIHSFKSRLTALLKKRVRTCSRSL